MGCATLLLTVPLDDLPTRFADSLESAAARVRALTADRAENGIRVALILAILATFVSLGSVFLLIACHRALAVWLGSAGASVVLGGLFLLAGWLIWSRGIVRSQGGK